MRKGERYSEVTPEMLQEFWKHRINPITGFVMYGKDTSDNNDKETRECRKRRKLYNQDEYYE